MALDFSKAASSSLAKERLNRAGENKNADVIVNIPVFQIKESPFNDGIPMEDIDALASSIREVGLLDPLVVYKKPGGEYELISGHRRLRAIKDLAWQKAPCVVRDYPEDALVRFRQHADANVQTRAKNVRFWIAEIQHASRLLTKTGFEGSVNDRVLRISEMLGEGASPAQVYRYKGIAKMDENILRLDRFGVSANTLYSAVTLNADEQARLAQMCETYMSSTEEDVLPKSKFLEFVKRVRGDIVTSESRKTSLGSKRPFYTRMCEMEQAFISRLQNAKKKDDVVAALQLISQMRGSLDSVEKQLRDKRDK